MLLLSGFEAFIQTFGSVTIGSVAILLAALFFIWKMFRKIQDGIVEHHEAEKAKNEKLQKALDAIAVYPQYRQQSIDIQKKLQGGIDKLTTTVERIEKRQDEIEAEHNQMKLNELRDKLIYNYQKYTSKEKNPMQAWTEMEKSSFYSIFRDYENLGGDGYMHTVVQPAMDLLRVIPEHEEEEVIKLLHSRK